MRLLKKKWIAKKPARSCAKARVTPASHRMAAPSAKAALLKSNRKAKQRQPTGAKGTRVASGTKVLAQATMPSEVGSTLFDVE
jgi:hypothetical protein